MVEFSLEPKRINQTTSPFGATSISKIRSAGHVISPVFLQEIAGLIKGIIWDYEALFLVEGGGVALVWRLVPLDFHEKPHSFLVLWSLLFWKSQALLETRITQPPNRTQRVCLSLPWKSTYHLNWTMMFFSDDSFPFKTVPFRGTLLNVFLMGNEGEKNKMQTFMLYVCKRLTTNWLQEPGGGGGLYFREGFCGPRNKSCRLSFGTIAIKSLRRQKKTNVLLGNLNGKGLGTSHILSKIYGGMLDLSKSRKKGGSPETKDP